MAIRWNRNRSPRTGYRHTEPGFTLLEILVALTVGALIFVMLGQGLKVGLSVWNSQSRAQNAGDVLAVERALRDLFGRMDPGLSQAEPAFFNGAQHTLAFATDLPQAASAEPMRRARVLLKTDDARRLVLQWTPDISGASRATARETTVLLVGVAALDIAYWLRGPTGGAWVGAWHDQRLPLLIRLHIVPVSGTRQRIPDLVIAPVRERWRS